MCSIYKLASKQIDFKNIKNKSKNIFSKKCIYKNQKKYIFNFLNFIPDCCLQIVNTILIKR